MKFEGTRVAHSTRVVAMKCVASNNTHAVIENCPVFAGRYYYGEPK